MPNITGATVCVWHLTCCACPCVQTIRTAAPAVAAQRDPQAQEGPHSAAAAMQARRTIAAAAWEWLTDGHLLQLADLQRALALVPCSLPALMQVCFSRPSCLLHECFLLAPVLLWLLCILQLAGCLS